MNMKRLSLVPILAFGCGTPDTDADGVDLVFDLGAWVGTRFEGPRLEGVEVLVDQPDGSRRTAVTGADGRATVSDFEWTGPITLTYWKPDRVVASYVDMDRATFESLLVDGAMRDVLTPVAWSTVSGRALNMSDEANTLGVFALHGGFFVGTAPTWSLPALPGHPLVLIGAEMVADGARWALVEAPAPNGDVTQDLDFGADARSATAYGGSFDIPEALRSARWGPEVYVQADGVALAGFAYTVQSTASGAEYAGGYVTVPTSLDADIRSLYGVSGRDGFSNVSIHGYPVDGPQSVVLPAVPELFDDVLTLSDPIEILEGQEEMFLVAKVLGPDGHARWAAASQVLGGTELRLPPIPDAALAQVNAGGDALTLQVYLCAGARTGYAFCDRAAAGRRSTGPLPDRESHGP